MGTVRPPQPVKVISGLIGGDPDLMARARKLLTKLLGPIDLTSDLWPFDSTAYYESEMGPGLHRQFVSFTELIQSDRIAEIKRSTNDIERTICDEVLADHDHRPVNLDPGYIELAKLVLATTKNHAHRIYLQRGIYAEVTLRYEQGAWQPWPWTYPDYAGGRYLAFFDRVRDVYKAQLNEMVG